MRRKELLQLYETVYTVDPKTGREKTESKYKGKYFRADAVRKRAVVQRLWLCFGAAVALFLLAGFVPSWSSLCGYVAPWYMLCLLPLLYLLMGTVRMTRMSERLTEVDMHDGLGYVKHASIGLVALGAAWAVADAVFLMASGLPSPWWQEALFLGCGAGNAAVGWLAHRTADSLKAEEMPNQEVQRR